MRDKVEFRVFIGWYDISVASAFLAPIFSGGRTFCIQRGSAYSYFRSDDFARRHRFPLSSLIEFPENGSMHLGSCFSFCALRNLLLPLPRLVYHAIIHRGVTDAPATNTLHRHRRCPRTITLLKHHVCNSIAMWFFHSNVRYLQDKYILSAPFFFFFLLQHGIQALPQDSLNLQNPSLCLCLNGLVVILL